MSPFIGGVRTWAENETLFVKSSIRHFFNCPIEREFIAVLLGMIGNLAFMIVKPFYIVEFNGSITGWQEPLWLTGHLAVGIVMVIWHHKTYCDIKRLVK